MHLLVAKGYRQGEHHFYSNSGVYFVYNCKLLEEMRDVYVVLMSVDNGLTYTLLPHYIVYICNQKPL